MHFLTMVRPQQREFHIEIQQTKQVGDTLVWDNEFYPTTKILTSFFSLKLMHTS